MRFWCSYNRVVAMSCRCIILSFNAYHPNERAGRSKEGRSEFEHPASVTLQQADRSNRKMASWMG